MVSHSISGALAVVEATVLVESYDGVLVPLLSILVHLISLEPLSSSLLGRRRYDAPWI
jgi:hypothetical protein